MIKYVVFLSLVIELGRSCFSHTQVSSNSIPLCIQVISSTPKGSMIHSLRMIDSFDHVVKNVLQIGPNSISPESGKITPCVRKSINKNSLEKSLYDLLKTAQETLGPVCASSSFRGLIIDFFKVVHCHVLTQTIHSFPHPCHKFLAYFLPSLFQVLENNL